jgi:RimJ/RimL family protein N-acetyltransferase
MAEVVAETDRLVLRTEAEGDQAVWLARMNTPEVMAYLGGVQSAEKVAESFAKMRAAPPDGPRFLLVALKDGTLIGKCGLVAIDSPAAPDTLRGQLQVGWTLGADYWGRGYALEAAKAALAMAFGQHGAPVVYAQTSQRNLASWGLMEKLGMTRLAQLDYPDPDYPPEDNPTMVYGLDRADWLANG